MAVDVGGFSRILSFKFPLNWPQNGQDKVLSFLAFFFESSLFLTFLRGRVFGSELLFVRFMVLFALFLHRWPRELCLWPPCPPSLSSLLFSSPLFSVVGLGFFLLPRFVRARRRRRRTVLALHVFSSLFSFFSFLLCRGRSPLLGLRSLLFPFFFLFLFFFFLFFFFSLILSFSLSLFLSSRLSFSLSCIAPLH